MTYQRWPTWWLA